MVSSYIKLVCLVLLFVIYIDATAHDKVASVPQSERLKEFLDGLSPEDKALLQKHPSKLQLIEDLLSNIRQTDPNARKRGLPSEDWKPKTKPVPQGRPSPVEKKEATKDSVRRPSSAKLNALTDKIIADIKQARQSGISLADLLRNINERNDGKTA